jgi:hypothetical protein
MTALTLGCAIEALDSGEVRIGSAIVPAHEARAVLVRLAECVGAAEHVGDWPSVRDALDRIYAGCHPVNVRFLDGAKEKGRGLFRPLPGGTRADVRLGDYVTARLVRSPGGRRWSGFVVVWAPDPLCGMVATATLRRVGVTWAQGRLTNARD